MYSILPHGLLSSYLRGVACVRVVDGRAEERSDLFIVVTHAGYIYYIVHDVMRYCTVVTIMSSMRHL